MNPACEICQGACCESVVLEPELNDVGAWLRLHGKDIGQGKIELATPCSKLCGGKCSVWENRPEVCRVYEVGGVDCRATVLRRRFPQALEIFCAMR